MPEVFKDTEKRYGIITGKAVCGMEKSQMGDLR